MCYHKNSVGLTVAMTEKCFVKNSCHSLVYCKDTGYVTLKSLNNEEIECLRLRSGLEFQEGSEICLYHYHFYLKAYSNRYKVCCNPLKNHNRSKSTRVKTTLKEILLKFAKQYGGLNLIPGQKLEVTDVKKPLKTFVKSQKEVISMIMMMILTVIMK